MRILFTSVGLPTRLFPLVPLAWACRCLGHEVLVATAGSLVGGILRTGLPAFSLGPAEETAAADGAAFARTARRNLRAMWELTERWVPDLVVSEQAEFAGPLVALTHDIPVAELHRELTSADEYRDAVRAELGDHPLWTGMPRSDLVLSPWPPSLRPVTSAAHQSMRHLPYSGGTRLPGRLIAAPRKPRICITLGGQDVAPLLEKLAVLDVEVVVGDRSALGSCAVMIGDGEQEVTLSALTLGCPQVVLPRSGDQYDNAGAVVKAGAGIRLLPGEVNPAAVVQACREVLADPGYAAASAVTAAEIAAQPVPSDIAVLLGCLA